MISAIILAAGESKRMGRPKMLLPWGKTTVLGHVIAVFKGAEVEDILVVTGSAREEVEAVAKSQQIRTIFNEEYALGEMLSSIQTGLGSQRPETDAVLIGLGDQPQAEKKSVRAIQLEYARSGASLIVPSYQMRRGHPWLVARPLWDELLAMKPPLSPRDFLNAHSAEIQYVNMDTSSVIEDLDTPEDYLKYMPGV